MPYSARLALVSLLAVAATVRASDRVDELIGSLANPDPAVRQKAFDDLIAIGEPAREKLAAASRSPRPAIATGAAAALAKLPWDRPGDSQPVSNALKLYGGSDENLRIGILLELLSNTDAAPDAPAAVVRVLGLEPSPRVAWTVALRADPDAGEAWKRACAGIDPATASVPLKLILASHEIASEKPDAKRKLHDALLAGREQILSMDSGVLLAAYGLAAQNELHADAAWLLEQFVENPEHEIVIAGNAPPASRNIELGARVQWHRFKDAESRKDDAAMRKLAADLLDSDSADMSIFLDILPTIETTADAGKIDAFFQRAYDRQQTRLNEEPDKPVHKNDMAWLLARSGRKLAEAEPLAEAAVKAKPDEAAYLDTLAEVKFRLGKIEEAIKLEEQALQHLPGDKFMTEQLARFKAARKTAPPAD